MTRNSGIDMVLPSDYDKLVVARQQELAYIAERLDEFVNAEEIDYEAFRDFRAWVRNRKTCLQPGKD